MLMEPRTTLLRYPPSRPPPTVEGRGLPSSAEGYAPPPRASPISSSADRRGLRASASAEGNPNPSRHQAMPTKGHSKKTKALGTPGICAHVHVGCSCPRWLITCSSYYFCSSHMFASRFFHVTNLLVSLFVIVNLLPVVIYLLPVVICCYYVHIGVAHVLVGYL